jgi:hypothetical protein
VVSYLHKIIMWKVWYFIVYFILWISWTTKFTNIGTRRKTMQCTLTVLKTHLSCKFKWYMIFSTWNIWWCGLGYLSDLIFRADSKVLIFQIFDCHIWAHMMKVIPEETRRWMNFRFFFHLEIAVFYVHLCNEHKINFNPLLVIMFTSIYTCLSWLILNR